MWIRSPMSIAATLGNAINREVLCSRSDAGILKCAGLLNAHPSYY